VTSEVKREGYLITRHPLLAVIAGLAVVIWICFVWAVARHTEAPAATVPQAPGGHTPTDADPKILRVCADPDNLPYANARGEGFDNAVAELLARELGRTLEYSWQPHRRGDGRATIHARVCDVLMNVPTSLERVRTTRPYYRSTYVFVTRRDRGLNLRSSEDPRLAGLRVGVQVAGEEFAPPSELALAARQVAGRLRDSTIYDDSHPGPRGSIVDAVARRDLDVAVVWGPVAGYYAGRERVPLTLAPLQAGGGEDVVPVAFDISIGVRPEDAPLHAELDAAIARRAADIHELLRRYGVPLVTGT
jgi:mxaJ protein